MIDIDETVEEGTDVFWSRCWKAVAAVIAVMMFVSVFPSAQDDDDELLIRQIAITHQMDHQIHHLAQDLYFEDAMVCTDAALKIDDLDGFTKKLHECGHKWHDDVAIDQMFAPAPE